jgi:hypothetical protein
MSKNLAEIPMPDLTDKDPRSAPPTVAAPKENNQNAGSADAIGTVTTLERPSSRDQLESVTTSRSATGGVVEAKSGAPLPVLARAASSPRSVSDALALLDASPAPAKHKSSSASLPASIEVDASLRQAFTARPAHEQIELLDRIANRISPVLGASIRAVFRHSPTIIGQDAAEYYELVVAVVDEQIPHSFQEVALVKQVVDAQWLALTFGQVQTSLLNAAIAAGLVDRISAHGEVENQSGEERKFQSRQWRRVVYAAVSGDEAMRLFIEEHVGAIAFDAFAAKRLVDDIRAHIFADKVVGAALKRASDAIRQLEKMREGRHKGAFMRAEELKAIEKGDAMVAFYKSLIAPKEKQK